jgi:hypothetical protein
VNWHFWGSLITNEHARLGAVESQGTAIEIATRATGLLFDQEFGLLALAPIYVLAAAGFVHLFRRTPRLAAHSVAILAAYAFTILLPSINVHGWTGGWSPSPRFLVPIAPLLGVAVVAAATAVRGARGTFVKLLVALQLAIDVVVWNAPKVLWNEGDGVSAVADAWPWLATVYAWMPTWFGPRPSALPFAAAAAVCSGITIWFLASEPDAGRRETGRRMRVRQPARA